MKKIYALLFVTILAAGLAACGGEAESRQVSTPAPLLVPSPTPQPTPEIPDYPIIINGVGFADSFYTLEDETYPTHVPLHVADILGLDIIAGGSQIAIQRNGAGLAFLSIMNYLAFGDDRVEVGIDDTFMAEDFTVYVALSLLREIGFEAYFMDGRVFINDNGGTSDSSFITIHGERFNTSLTTLVLPNWNLTDEDVAQLRYMPNLTGLSLEFDQTTDFTPLSSLTNLTFLSLNGAWSEMTELPPSLSSLAVLTNLTHFNIELLGNQITDLSPLAGLSNLTELNAVNNGISDLTPLAGANMPNLWRLSVSMNFVRDITPLGQANLTGLTDLSLDDNIITDVTPLANLTSLHVLLIANNPIGDIAPLANMTNLVALVMPNTAVSDIDAVRGMTNLFSLIADYNYISDLTPLSDLANIRTLSIRNNQVTDITPLVGLTDLHSLDARYNQIADLTPLANIQGWGPSDLWLQGNPIIDWSPVAHVEWVGGRP